MGFFLKHRSVISYFSFSMATSALGFVASLLMIRLMSPEEFGRIAILLSVLFISVPLVSFAADNLVAINKAKMDLAQYEHFRCGYVTFAYMMFVIMQWAFILLMELGVLHDYLFLLTPLYGLIRFLIGLASIEYVMEEKSFQYGMVSFFTTLISLLLTVLSLRVFSGAADWRIAALMLSDIIFLIIRYRGRMRLLWTFTVNKKVFKGILQFGFPLLLSVAPAWALNESDKIIVAKFSDMESVGYYAAACSIGGIMITFNTAMLNAMVPNIYKALGEDPGEMMSIVKRSVMRFLSVSAGFGCVFALGYGLAADLILPEKYAAARQIVFVVILFSLGRALYAVLGLVTDYYSMTIVKLKGIVYGSITTVVTAIFGVMHFGVIGVAIGVGTGYLVLSLVLLSHLMKKSHQPTTVCEVGN